MTDYKSKLGGLADKLKSAAVATPIQEVNPIKPVNPLEEGECRFNNWIPVSLKKKLKRFAADNDMTLKDINIEALKLYLKAFKERDTIDRE